MKVVEIWFCCCQDWDSTDIAWQWLAPAPTTVETCSECGYQFSVKVILSSFSVPFQWGEVEADQRHMYTILRAMMLVTDAKGSCQLAYQTDLGKHPFQHTGSTIIKMLLEPGTVLGSGVSRMRGRMWLLVSWTVCETLYSQNYRSNQWQLNGSLIVQGHHPFEMLFWQEFCTIKSWRCEIITKARARYREFS